jgi:hypothetical protein
LIGEPKELSPELKTKDNVVHVGPSPLLELLKVSLPSKDMDSKLSLNNNWLTVPLLMEIMDVVEDLWTMDSNTSLIMESPENLPILIDMLTNPVKLILVPSKSDLTVMSLEDPSLP